MDFAKEEYIGYNGMIQRQILENHNGRVIFRRVSKSEYLNSNLPLLQRKDFDNKFSINEIILYTLVYIFVLFISIKMLNNVIAGFIWSLLCIPGAFITTGFIMQKLDNK